MKNRASLVLERVAPFGGVLAATTLAVLVNVFAARHFTRWDVTAERRYSLSPATVQTLRELPRKVELWVLLPGGDPLRESVKQLLVAYRSETDQLDVRYIDPDRDPLAYADVARRFKLGGGRSEEGAVASEAVMVAAAGERSWFITPRDLVQIEDPDDPRAKPREERAITGALRNVLGAKKNRLCFTQGAGELSLDEGGGEGLGALADLLQSDNYEIAGVDPGAPAALEPFTGCDVVVVAGPRAAFDAKSAERLRSWLLAGGNALIASSPINADTDSGMTSSGLEPVLRPFGIDVEDALAIETDEDRVYPESRGIRFVAQPKAHAITAGLLPGPSGRMPPRIIVHFARALRPVSDDGAAQASVLLTTSERSYAVTRTKGAAAWEGAPPRSAADLPGPLALAMAAERPKTHADAPHGPRLVVIGTGAAMIQTNWQLDAQNRGMASLVESSIAWLAATPQVLDVPDKPDVAAGVRLTEQSRAEILRYVLFYMPLAATALGLFVFFRRRSSEGAPLRKKP